MRRARKTLTLAAAAAGFAAVTVGLGSPALATNYTGTPRTCTDLAPGDTPPWRGACHSTVDNTAPAAGPVVGSAKYDVADYPGTGGPGVPATFVFDAGGDRDVVAFEYHELNLNTTKRVAPNHPGGQATVRVTPAGWGPDHLQVQSIDAAGNRSPWTTYSYYVRNPAAFADITVAGVGLTSHITLTTPAPGMTSFGYAVDGGPETRLPAAPGPATGTLVFAHPGYATITEHAYAGHKLIGSYTQQLDITDAPAVSSAKFAPTTRPIAGDPGRFTFTPHTTGVVAYRYDFDDGRAGRIDAAADGTAVLPWTPSRGDHYTLTVRSETAGGTVSSPARYEFRVIDPRPSVTSDAGVDSPRRDGVGAPTTVYLNSDRPDFAGFVYSFDGGPERTAGPHPYAEVTVVPPHAGDNTFTARVRRADGALSPATTATIRISSGPLVTADGSYGRAGIVGLVDTFTFKPGRPGVATYHYRWDDGAGEQTTAAGADGTARVSYTPALPRDHRLTVYSVGVDGAVSDTRTFAFAVDDPRVDTGGSSWDDRLPALGLGVPGELRFGGDLADATKAFLWHVGDEPVQSTPAAGNTTHVPYTPSHNGSNTLYVQREFIDGALSPITEVTFLVGTMPQVTSDFGPHGEDPHGEDPHGEERTTGTLTFSGGMPGIVAYHYSITGGGSANATSGSVPADAAQVQFSPAGSGWYTVTVTGHTADGSTSDERQYQFFVA